ncbi:MAG TPA: response regulator transcription factor [Bacteroidales bacterium]|nr:response regulator transcription factor [Bacteroidales bacterium]
MEYKIMIVDDHALVRKGIRALIEAHFPQWDIIESENGIQAIIAASTMGQGIILMDFDMPKLDGLTAAKQILKDNPGSRILMISMHQEQEISTRLETSGVMGLISKNATDNEFVEAIEKVRNGIPFFPDRILAKSQLPDGTWVFGEDCPQEEGLEALTLREKEIFRLLTEGMSPAVIAAKLFISIKTIDTHKMNIFKKCGVHSIPELLRYAYRHNAI